MSIDYGNWGSHILFASACIVTGIVGVVLARTETERWLRQSALLQAILLVYVVSAAFFQRQNELKLGGVVIVGLLIIQAILGSPNVTDEPPVGEEQSAP
ncbi:MAG: hypothetical protein WCH39_03325 [Schlesneria sp.]